MNLRALGKMLAYESGALGAYHKLRHAQTLTVVMFHRVLPAAAVDGLGADPQYTVTPEFLADCVKFLRKHYTIVSLDDVLRSYNRIAPLPPSAALISFDDGWYDNLQYALPVLHQLPWTIFAALDAISDPDCWWQEVLLWAIRTNRCDTNGILPTAGKAIDLEKHEDLTHRFLAHVEGLPPAERDSFLAPYRAILREGIYSQRMMLSGEDLCVLSEAGVSIGAHGDSHLPMTMLADSKSDLARSRDGLARYIGRVPIAMSFPHGLHDDNSVREAHETGFPLLFTSEPHINGCEDGWVSSGLLGRIAIDMHDVADDAGALAPDKLAAWLFLRDIVPAPERR